jgi:4-amino-4-deoxy-L-arabinose transferase-like glycosyltransferase
VTAADAVPDAGGSASSAFLDAPADVPLRSQADEVLRHDEVGVTSTGGPAVVTAGPRSWLALCSLLAVHVTLLLVYSVLTPTFRGPDEYVHVDLALAMADGADYPAFDERRVAASIFAARDTSPAYRSYAPAIGEGAAAPRDARPAFRDLAPGVATEIVNPIAQHPPLYYRLAGGVLALLDRFLGASDWPFDRQVAALRLLDVVLVAPVPLLVWLTARRLGLAPVAGIAAAAMTVGMPSFTHIGSVVNNDNLLVLLGGVLALLVARILTGDRSWSTALLGGLVLGLALFTKGFALVLVPWLVLAYAVALLPSRQVGVLVSRGGLALVVAFAAGGWWWARNLLVDGVLLPAVGLRDRVPVDPDVGEFAGGFLDRLLSGVWGSFGWREAELPIALAAGLSVALVVALVAGVATARRRAPLLVLLLPVAVLVPLLGANSWRAYLKTGVPYATQGRYLFAGLVGLLVVAAAGAGALAGRRHRWLPLGVLVLGVLLHAAAVDTITGRYWEGDRIGALLAFSPWPPAVVVALVAAAVTAVVVAAVVLRPRSGDVAAGAWRGAAPRS